MSIKDSIDDSVDLENRSPQSTRLFTKVAITASTLSLLLLFVSAITYQIDSVLGLNVFASVFIPAAILFIAGFYLAITERLRAKYMGARIAIIISCIAFIALMTVIIFELVKYGEIFIAPFNPPDHYNLNG